MILAGFTLLAAGLGKRLPTGFVPEEDQGFVMLNVQLPPAASLQRTDAVAARSRRSSARRTGIQAFNTIAGFSLLTR